MQESTVAACQHSAAWMGAECAVASGSLLLGRGKVSKASIKHIIYPLERVCA